MQGLFPFLSPLCLGNKMSIMFNFLFLGLFYDTEVMQKSENEMLQHLPLPWLARCASDL